MEAWMLSGSVMACVMAAMQLAGAQPPQPTSPLWDMAKDSLVLMTLVLVFGSLGWLGKTVVLPAMRELSEAMKSMAAASLGNKATAESLERSMREFQLIRQDRAAQEQARETIAGAIADVMKDTERRRARQEGGHE